MLRLEVGTDTLGDVDPKAASRSDIRDIQSDLAGQSLTASESSLSEYSLSANGTPLDPNYGVSTTAVNSTSPVAVPQVAGSTPYYDSTPDLSGVKRTVQWKAKSSGKVIR